MYGILALLALLNGLGAVANIAFTLFGPDRLQGGLAWNATKLLESALIIAVSAWTMRHSLNPNRSGLSRPLLFAGGLLLIGIGSASVVWQLHLTETTGDFEGYAFLLSATLIAQGVLTAWLLFADAMRPKLRNSSQ